MKRKPHNSTGVNEVTYTLRLKKSPDKRADDFTWELREVLRSAGFEIKALKQQHKKRELPIPEEYGADLAIKDKWELGSKYLCRIKQRPEYRGRKLKESCKVLDGLEMELEYQWLMDESDPYPNEVALSAYDENYHNKLMTLAGITWIASGDVEIIKS